MKYKKAFVTGGAGFIGSNLCDRLLLGGYQVTAYDNFSTGFPQFLQNARKHKKFRLLKGDLLDKNKLGRAMRGCNLVFHLAANADVRFGVDHPNKDLEQNTIATFNVLEAMRANEIKRLAFSSTGSIYGEPTVFPTPEDAPFPIQTSFYGASKLACEGLIEAYCSGFDFQAWIFRFVSVLGECYTHGHVLDFYKQLLADPTRLKVLGDGKQRKSYVYIQDCIDGIFLAMEHAQEQVNILNIGRPDYAEVNDSAGWICKHLGVSPKIMHSGGKRGWVGDSPLILLDTTRIKRLGWQPKISIQEGVERTVKWLEENQWVLKIRK